MFALLLGSAYKNNLVSLLSYFLLSLGVACLIWTYNNLRNIEIEDVEITGAFAGSEFIVSVITMNNSQESRFALEMGVRGKTAKSSYDRASQIQAGGRLKITAAFSAELRGKYKLGKIRVSSVYPLGLFESRISKDLNVEYFVYPKPAQSGAQGLAPRADDSANEGSDPGEDFRGHRKFQIGDSQRHIDWKAYARGRTLMTKEFNSATALPHVLLDWDLINEKDDETKLSVLAFQIEELKQKNESFALKMPGKNIAAGKGFKQATTCLQTLAVFESPKRSA